MKKTLLLFFAAFLLLSCDDNYSYPEDLTTKQIVNLKVNASEWTEYSDNTGVRYYYCFVRMNEITYDIYTHGGVMAYLDLSNRQQVLPYTRNYKNTSGALWTKTIDYDISEGGLTFYVTNSDFVVEPPETMYFKVLLFW